MKPVMVIFMALDIVVKINQSSTTYMAPTFSILVIFVVPFAFYTSAGKFSVTICSQKVFNTGLKMQKYLKNSKCLEILGKFGLIESIDGVMRVNNMNRKYFIALNRFSTA